MRFGLLEWGKKAVSVRLSLREGMICDGHNTVSYEFMSLDNTYIGMQKEEEDEDEGIK